MPKKITVADVITAMEKNGFRHARGQWFSNRQEDGKINAACIMGQAAINLGVRDSDISLILRRADRLDMVIVYWNDTERLPYKTILRKIKKRVAGKEHLVIEANEMEYNFVRKDGSTT